MGTNQEPIHSEIADRFNTLLTERQRQCLRGVFDGGEVKDIARSLDISTRVVEEHLAKARAKLGISRSAAAARLVGAALGWASVGPPVGSTEVGSSATARLYTGMGRRPDALHAVRDSLVPYRFSAGTPDVSTGDQPRTERLFDRVIRLLVVLFLLAGLTIMFLHLPDLFNRLASIVRPAH
jgi:DNA-binding CsgD family transcriptional regulator